MHCDCHIHMALDGSDWKAALARHKTAPDEVFIRATLKNYQALGFDFLRDGGDRWGAGEFAAKIAGEYGICYRTPCFPIYKRGHYGSFIGRGYETLDEFRALVREVKERGGHFIKIMISGLMDFNHYGILTDTPMPADEVAAITDIAHEAGFAVMAHANGDAAVSAAIAAGIDSVEHGAYLTEETLHQLAESRTVWVPTLATIGNLVGEGRFPDEAVKPLLAYQEAAVAKAAALALGPCRTAKADWTSSTGCVRRSAAMRMRFWSAVRQRSGNDSERRCAMGGKKTKTTKKKIVSAAWRLFYEQGYDNTTVDDIVEESGTSKGSFYHYFDGKDALLSSLSILFDEKYEELWPGIPVEMDSLEKLAYLTRELFGFIEDTVSLELLARLFSSQLITKGERHLLDHSRVYYRVLRTILAEGQQRGQIRDDVTVNELSKLYALLERGLMYDWCICNGDYSLKSYAERTMPMLLAAFQKK